MEPGMGSLRGPKIMVNVSFYPVVDEGMPVHGIIIIYISYVLHRYFFGANM